ncbi:MAG: biotin--[acetyl-CoA-carboxylase] ligase [Henriciella sp.]
MIETAPIHWFEQVDSTSEELKRRARRGALEPVWIAARQQIAGRGRLGRNWVSPEGNLFVSLLCTLPEGVSAATRVPFATGLAVRDACISVLPGTDFRLKWPNDVRVDGAKLAGVLVESGQTDSTFWVIIGIGVNVQVAPDNTGQASISLVDLGAPPETSPDEVLLALRTALARTCAVLAGGAGVSADKAEVTPSLYKMAKCDDITSLTSTRPQPTGCT